MIEEQAGLDHVRPLIGDLQQIVHALSISASSTTAGSTSNGGGGNGAAAASEQDDEEVVDAEFTRE